MVSNSQRYFRPLASLTDTTLAAIARNLLPSMLKLHKPFQTTIQPTPLPRSMPPSRRSSQRDSASKVSPLSSSSRMASPPSTLVEEPRTLSFPGSSRRADLQALPLTAPVSRRRLMTASLSLPTSEKSLMLFSPLPTTQLLMLKIKSFLSTPTTLLAPKNSELPSLVRSSSESSRPTSTSSLVLPTRNLFLPGTNP